MSRNGLAFCVIYRTDDWNLNAWEAEVQMIPQALLWFQVS